MIEIPTTISSIPEFPQAYNCNHSIFFIYIQTLLSLEIPVGNILFSFYFNQNHQAWHIDYRHKKITLRKPNWGVKKGENRRNNLLLCSIYCFIGSSQEKQTKTLWWKVLEFTLDCSARKIPCRKLRKCTK